MVQLSPSVVEPGGFFDRSDGKPRRIRPLRFWLWFNVLSLDAPLVAVVWQWFFARCYGVSLHWPGIVSLALSVWLIYVVDRLLDVQGPHPPQTARHSFTRQHRRWFGLAAFASLPVLFWASIHLSSIVIRNGLFMGLGVALYFMAVHAAPPQWRGLWPKELAVGVIFAIGTSLVVWSRMTMDSRQLMASASLFAALCWLNCVAIEHWEWKQREWKQQWSESGGWHAPVSPTEPHCWTRWVGRHMVQATFAIAIASFLLLPSGPSRQMTVAATLSAGGLLWLEWRSRVLSLDALRVMADAVLLSPAVFLLARS